MRSFWSGEIAFGLVTVAAKLFAATKDLTPHFRLLHKECGTPIVTVRRCPKHERDLSWDEIGKGYEVSKGQYVLFTAEELAKLDGDEAGGTIEIVQFVDPLEVDLAFVENSYWVAAAGKSSRAYDLLRQVLERKKTVALAKVRLRTRTRMSLLRPRDGMFALDILRFAEEIVPPDAIAVETQRKERSPTARETTLALRLVDELMGPFDPQKHPDAYRNAVQSAADAKFAAGEAREGGGGGGRGEGDRGGEVIDLAQLLARSIGTPAKHARAAGRTPGVARSKPGKRRSESSGRRAAG